MIVVKLPTRILGVDFTYPKKFKQSGSRKGEMYRATRCMIYSLVPDGDGVKDAILITSQDINCWTEDRFVKAKGRLRALERALAIIVTSKAERAIVWDAVLTPQASPEKARMVEWLEGMVTGNPSPASLSFGISRLLKHVRHNWS